MIYFHDKAQKGSGFLSCFQHLNFQFNSYEESQSTDETELGMVRSQIHNEMTDTQKDTVGAFRDTRLDEENTMLRKEGQMSQDETLNRNKETENTRVEVSYNAQDKTEGNSEVGNVFRSFAFGKKNNPTTWKKPQTRTYCRPLCVVDACLSCLTAFEN